MKNHDLTVSFSITYDEAAFEKHLQQRIAEYGELVKYFSAEDFAALTREAMCEAGWTVKIVRR